MDNLEDKTDIEYLDLVDEHDNVFDKEERDKILASGQRNYRVINIFIFNTKGELIVPKRSTNRKLFPGCYDFSVGGHVSAGETYEQAAYRELQEELGIQGVKLKEIGYFHPDDIGTSSFSKLYQLKYDGVIHIDKDGIEKLHYFKVTDIYELLKKNPKMFKGDFKPLLEWYIEQYGVC